MFAKFNDIPSLSVQYIKEKPKCCGQRITKGNNSNRTGPYPLFFYYKCQFVDINVFAKFDEIPLLPVQVIKDQLTKF